MPSTTHAEHTRQESELLQHAITLWRKAQVLYQGCSWDGRPEALAIAEQIAAGNPECEPLLSALLFESNQLVVAYALLTLELMRSPVLLDLPADLLKRRSSVMLGFTGVMTPTNLGALAKQVQKRARQRASERPTPVRP